MKTAQPDSQVTQVPATSACPTVGFQVVCLEADVVIQTAAVPQAASVTCLGPGQVVPVGASVCPPSAAPCGFTVAQRLCVAVPVSFTAAALPGRARQRCFPPTASPCCPFFQPKSVGFFGQLFTLTNFSATAVCQAVECVSAHSSFLGSLLTLCPAAGQPCPPDASLAACTAQVRSLLTQAGALSVLQIRCPPGPGQNNGALATTLRQLLAVWLDVCLCTTSTGGVQVGGVELYYQVDLSQFSRATLRALGLTETCETVGAVVAKAESILATCNRTLAGLIAPILGAMALDASLTIIRPVPCP